MDKLLPSGRVTGIGSLPHLDADEAIDFVARFCPDIPFWPQLPQLSPAEELIPQMLSPLLDLVEGHSPARLEIRPGGFNDFRRALHEVSIAGFREDSATGFFAFEDACRANLFAGAIALKGQIIGPFTLGWCLSHNGIPLATLPDVYGELVTYLCHLASWQIGQLKQFGKPVILFIDEPMLALRSTACYLVEGIKRLTESICADGAYAGIHCCATPAPVSICSLQPNIISFDAHAGLEALLSQPETRSFIESNGCLAFGLVPTWSSLDSFSPTETFIRWIMAVSEMGSIQTMAEQSLITASCGLGLLRVEAAQASFLKAAELSQLIRKVASQTTDRLAGF